MFKVHRNLYDAQENGKEVKIETHEVKSEPKIVETVRTVAQESEAEKPVKSGKKRKKAKKEEV